MNCGRVYDGWEDRSCSKPPQQRDVQFARNGGSCTLSGFSSARPEPAPPCRVVAMGNTRSLAAATAQRELTLLQQNVWSGHVAFMARLKSLDQARIGDYIILHILRS